ncbi:hypothetical protein [Paenibacillus lactis]|uniref:Uncharacterized protein n=1 Tax=Paenibacillus lactis TaxID=228574 RepID=A0ABS4F4F2_9BACL|nr:hypothetical protein [Paenibacillus lactis]MBP1891121.1 hypothetical protein [Paenibacillus lactis]MCM3493575.1 hypothetical protein [Paenibacillus lactis]GIO93069.1 hypothetical protein J31TS3_42960 [Paenibacillus lactis]HAG00456.1 hypothetical protein [Paenibacillus lactis]
MSLLIHEQKEPKMQPFYWILTFEAYSIAMLLGLGLIVGPVVLLLLWPSVWTWLSLLAVPVGIIMFVKLLKSLRKQVWANTHLDRYALYEDRVDYELWDPATGESEQGSVRLTDVVEMYYGRYVLQYSYAYKKTKMMERSPVVELMPVLYLIARSGMRERAIAIPFLDPMDANRWLEVMSGRNVPLYLTSLIIHDFRDASVPQQLRSDEDLKAAEFDGNIERDFRPYMEQLIEEEEQREYTEAELEELEHGMKLLEYEEELRKRKSAFRGVGKLAWLVFPVQFAIGYWLVRLADNGSINPNNYAYSISLLGSFSILFFILVKWMRWPQIIIFSLASLASFFFVDFSDIETDPSYIMSGSLLALSFMLLPLYGLVYLGIRRLRKDRDAKNLPPAPEPYRPAANAPESEIEVYKS